MKQCCLLNHYQMKVKCPYCKEPARLVTGEIVYTHRPDLYHKLFWYCQPCRAWVGTHYGTEKPLGRLANKELRQLKIQAHAAFDPMWREGFLKRNKAYRWLADQLKIPYKKCHIGYFDEEMCRRVIEVCQNATECDKGK